MQGTGYLDLSAVNTISMDAGNNIAISSTTGTINLSTSADQDINMTADQFRFTSSNAIGMVLVDSASSNFVIDAQENLKIQTSGAPNRDLTLEATGTQTYTTSETTANGFQFNSQTSGLDMYLNHTGSKGYFECCLHDDGTQSSFYVNYAMQASMLNPGLTAMIENQQTMQKLKPNEPVSVPKKVFKDILELLPGEFVQVAPLFFNFPSVS